jgi:hypothetical protein
MNAVRRSRFTAGLAALAIGGALALLGAGPAQAARSGTVYVLQGLAGRTADVAVDGSGVASGVAAKTVVGPLRLSAGRHVVTFSSKGTRLTSVSVDVSAGGSLDVLAYWAAETPAMPRVTVLRNDLSPVGSGRTRLVVTHAIAGPPADIRVNGKVIFRSVANGESLSVTVPAGTYAVTALATLGGKVLLPKASLLVKGGTLTRAVAIGAPSGTPDVLVHVLPISGPASGDRTPSSVHTGDGGQAAALFGGPVNELAGLPRLPFALLSAAFLLVAVSLLATAHRSAGRRHAR